MLTSPPCSKREGKEQTERVEEGGRESERAKAGERERGGGGSERERGSE